MEIYLRNFVKSTTAALVGDYVKPCEIEKPRCRIRARFGVTVFTLVGILSLVVWQYSQQPTLRTTRHWDTNFPLTHFARFINNSTGTIKYDAVSRKRIPSLVCPCSRADFSWCEYTKFFSIQIKSGSKASGGLRERKDSVTITHIPTGFYYYTKTKFTKRRVSMQKASEYAIVTMINSVTSKTDQRTAYQSTVLLDPLTLSQTIARRIVTNLYTQLSSYVPFQGSGHTRPIWTFTRDVYDLWQTMANQSMRKPDSTPLDFWNAAAVKILGKTNDSVLTVSVNKAAIGMVVNWTNYVNVCKPLYCDEVYEASIAYRFVQTLIALGGIGALILFVVRQILWPLVCWAMQSPDNLAAN